MENRSFDTILGRLKWDGINPEVNGLVGNEFNVLESGEVIKIMPGVGPETKFDPGHDIDRFTQQIYGMGTINTAGLTPTMSGFAKQAYVESHHNMESTKEIFKAYGPDVLPVTYALAQEFTVIDDWFSSFPGATYPNRHFVHCATSSGRTLNTDNIKGVPCKTIFNHLDKNKNSWKVYSDSARISTLLYRDMRHPKRLFNLRKTSHFKRDCAAGKLPQYSFLDPSYDKNDNHPPGNFNNGEAYVKEIYEAIRSSPQWNQTLFLLTYDEGGGFYDHVLPPTGVPIPDTKYPRPSFGDFNFDRLGTRVPTILISPLVPKGKVARSTVPGRHFEHSSIAATIKKVFGLPNFLTKRDEWALPFDTIANLPEPRAHPFAHLVVECEQVTGHRIQSGLVPAIQKSRLRLLGRALDSGVENVYIWLRGGVLNGEADLDQRWLDGTVEHESMGTRHDNQALDSNG
ncbi:hypothetical protein BASA81_013575 [Batrachochytrium salamandrivorans]|nr:hypothetical protein BASA81_013575 [Batrachochytrium salamandrivorans]